MFPKSLYQYALLATCISPSFATLFTDPSQLTKSTYDYVIVGGEYFILGATIICSHASFAQLALLVTLLRHVLQKIAEYLSLSWRLVYRKSM